MILLPLNRKVAVLEGLHHCGTRRLGELAELQLLRVQALFVLEGALALPSIQVKVVEGQSRNRVVGLWLLLLLGTQRSALVRSIFALEALHLRLRHSHDDRGFISSVGTDVLDDDARLLVGNEVGVVLGLCLGLWILILGR